MEIATYRQQKPKQQMQIYIGHIVYGRFLVYLEEK